MRELEIPETSRGRVRDIASWSGIENAITDQWLRTVFEPVVATELRRLAREYREGADARDLIERAEELDPGRCSLCDGDSGA